MDVILLERIEKLGQMGDVVKVKAGYARNYLLPQRKAMRATKDNLALFETQRAQLEAENLKRRDEAESVAAKMDDLTIVLIRQAGESGHLYGSVNARDIAAAVTEAGFSIDRRQVQREQPIKELGVHPARISLHPEVGVTVTVNVAQSEEEAQAQARRAAAGEEPVALGERAETETGVGEVEEVAAAAGDGGESAEPKAESGDAAPEKSD